MRITSGIFKGFPLLHPNNKSFRPTQEKVRSALFDAYIAAVRDADVLDLCCGTGSIGYEALSRGAKSVTLLDIDIHYAGRNRDELIRRLPPELQSEYREKITVIRSSIRDFSRRYRTQFDIIFFDPPWDKESVYRDTLEWVGSSDILRKNGRLICEHRRRFTPDISESLIVNRRHSYGETVLSVYSHHELIKENE